MPGIPLLDELLLILVVALSTVLLFHRAGIPSTVGLLAAGVIIGPSVLGVMDDPRTAEIFTELGLIPLLFVVGMEFSIEELKRLRDIALTGGAFQIVMTTLVVVLIAYIMGFPSREALFLGFIVALSSTALVVKLLTERGEVDTPQGKILIGILLAQDIFVILLIFLLPIFGAEEFVLAQGAGRFVLALSVITGVFLLSQRVLPKAFAYLSSIKEREVHTIAIFIFIVGVVWITTRAGLSVALGAFLAGVLLSGQEYRHYAASQILPFKDILSSLFFISIGMLLDVGFFADHLFTILAVTSGVLVAKALLAFLATIMMGFPVRIAVIVGLGLSQLGEFSFILAEAGKGFDLIREETFQTVVAATIFTLFITPFLMRVSSRLGYAFSRIEPGDERVETPGLSNHTVVIGYGLNGRNLARVLRATSIPYVVVDIDPKVVKRGREEGYNVVFGDATQPSTLEGLGIGEARVCVIAISDRVATERIVSLIKGLNPDVRVIVRTRYASDVRRLFEIGASQVIPEEFETSVEIFVRVLREYGVPGNIISSQVAYIRQDGYRVLREQYQPADGIGKLMDLLGGSIVETFFVGEGAWIEGKTLGELDLRGRTGATVIAVIRDSRSFVNPGADFSFQRGDTLVIMGSHAQIDRAYLFLGGVERRL